MSSPSRTYTRLTRNRSQLGRYTSLWLGPDHLLLVTSSGYAEEYSRVMLRDVKGIFVTPSDLRLWCRLGFGIPALICLVVVLMTAKNNDVPYVSGLILLFCSVFLIWNEVLGPSCRVVVVTGVQSAPIHSLARRRKTDRVLARVRPLIEAAQADSAAPPPAPPPPVPPLPSAEPPSTPSS